MNWRRVQPCVTLDECMCDLACVRDSPCSCGPYGPCEEIAQQQQLQKVNRCYSRRRCSPRARDGEIRNMDFQATTRTETLPVTSRVWSENACGGHGKHLWQRQGGTADLTGLCDSRGTRPMLGSRRCNPRATCHHRLRGNKSRSLQTPRSTENLVTMASLPKRPSCLLTESTTTTPARGRWTWRGLGQTHSSPRVRDCSVCSPMGGSLHCFLTAPEEQSNQVVLGSTEMRHSLTASVQTFVWSLTDFLERPDLDAIGLVTKGDSKCMTDLWGWCRGRHLHAQTSVVMSPAHSVVRILREHSQPSMHAYYTQWAVQHIRTYLLRIRSQYIGTNRRIHWNIGYCSKQLSCMYQFKMTWNRAECDLWEKPERSPLGFRPNPQGVCTQAWLPALQDIDSVVDGQQMEIVTTARLCLYLLVEHASTCNVSMMDDWWHQQPFDALCRELGAEITTTGTLTYNSRPWTEWMNLSKSWWP
jgi:hypothetical protein